MAPPPVTLCPRHNVYVPCYMSAITEVIGTLVVKHAIECLSSVPSVPGFYSPIFIVLKKDSGQMRSIFNMKGFNSQYLDAPPHFSMNATICTINATRQLHSQPRPHLHIPIHLHLRFIFYGMHHQWMVLPFGICTAPWLFTRLMKPVTQFLHLQGIVFEAYIDDCMPSQRHW